MANFARTSTWKKSSSFLYSVGAAIVMLGALAKLTHFSLGGVPVGNLLLAVGLIAEAVIFFVSAFEPIHEQYDWSLVYPELAGLEANGKRKPLSAEGLEKLNEFFQNSHFDNTTIEKLGKGLNNLGNTASKLHDISDASVATNEYVQNIKQASLSINQFYQANRQGIDSYTELTKMLGGDVNRIKQSVNNYNETLDNFNNNLLLLSEAYTKQLEKFSLKFENLEAMQDKMNKTLHELNLGVEGAKVFKEQTEMLSKNLEALNRIYANMLSAMSINK